MDPHQYMQGLRASMEGGPSSPLQLINLIHSNQLVPGNPVLNHVFLTWVDTTLRQCYTTQRNLEECRRLILLVFKTPGFTPLELAKFRHWRDLFDSLFPYLSSSDQGSAAESGYSSGGSDRSSSCSPSPTQDGMFVYNASAAFLVPSFPPMSIVPPPPPPPPAPSNTHHHHHARLVKTSSEPVNYMGTRCKVAPRERAIDVTNHITGLLSWLKTLRLHKYYSNLSSLTFERMMNLNDGDLCEITDGARKKILLNLQKLNERIPVLQNMTSELSKPGRFSGCVSELHNLLMKTPFPLPPSSPLARNPVKDYDAPVENIIVQFTGVLESAYNIILANSIEEEAQRQFFRLLEDAAQHAAFPTKQRRMVCEILQQCIENYNYRHGQVMQLKRFDLSNYPDSVKIKYPFKPQTGVNHQSSSFNGYNKFHRANNNGGLGGNGNGKTWQTNGGNGCRPTVHSTLHVTRSAPPAVAPPLFSPYNSIWSPQTPGTSQNSHGQHAASHTNITPNLTPPKGAFQHPPSPPVINTNTVGDDSVRFTVDFTSATLLDITHSLTNEQGASSTSSPFGCNSLPSDSLCSGGPSDLNEYNCLESLCSQIAECALAEK